MVDYKPYKDDLYEYRMRLRIRLNQSFKLVFRNNLSQKFFNIIKRTVNEKLGFRENLILSISGFSGTGKSITILSIGKKFFPSFTWRNMMFFDQQILDTAHKFPPNTLLVRDENPARAIYGQGSTRIEGQVAVLADTCRKYGQNLAFVEPRFKENETTKWYLETVDMDLKNRITRMALMDAHTKYFIGAVLVPVLPDNDPDWVKYNDFKDAFIEKVRSGDFSGAKTDYKAMAKECMDDPDFEKYQKITEKKAYLVTKYPNLTTGEIQTILALIKVAERED